MATSENVAFARRLDAVEQAVNGLRLIWVRTTIAVYDRQVEPDYMSWTEVKAAAKHPPRPVEVRRMPDLELLIDPVSQIRKLRNDLSPEGQAEFDDIKQRAEIVDIEISCHEKQLGAILSDSPTTAAIGGNRAGKSMILVFWLLRRWIMRGGPGCVFWWIAPQISKMFEQGVYAIAGQGARGRGFWPDALMRLPKKGIAKTNQRPTIEMIDGSVIGFMHGHGDGGNLKSANVVDIVLDELGEIDDVDNLHQAKIRVSQTGGCVSTATTRKRGHWMDEEITQRAKEDGPDVVYLTEFDLFDSPWMTLARIFQLFVNDKTVNKRQLESQVLPAVDKRAICLELAKTNPKSLREHFGIETATCLLMWSEWRDVMVYRSDEHRHERLYVNRDGGSVALVNITRAVMANKWPQQTHSGQRFDAFAGCDFNVRGHAAVLELFGEGRTVAEAMSKPDTWTVLVTDEVQVDGTTQRLAEQLRAQAGECPVWYDPHGAKGHTARGTGNTTDAAELRKAGHAAAPANGTSMTSFKPLQLDQVASSNAMNRLMAEGRFFVHERCVGTLEAMKKDQRGPDGRRVKRSSPDSMSDWLSGRTDSVRYAVWPVFRSVLNIDHPRGADE